MKPSLWLLVQGEAEIGDAVLDRMFVLQGVDAERWLQLLQDPDVNEQLVDIGTDGVSIRMDSGAGIGINSTVWPSPSSSNIVCSMALRVG